MKNVYIGTGCKKTDGVFVGQINVYEHYTFLWTQSSEIERLTSKDALADAIKMKEELLTLNKI